MPPASPGTARMEDLSDSVAQVALQGPRSKEILLRLLPEEPSCPRSTTASSGRWSSRGSSAWSPAPGTPGSSAMSSTAPTPTPGGCGTCCWTPGRTWASSPAAWGPGTPCGWRPPCPSTAMSSHEDTGPLEAGLDFAVKLGKPDFIGKAGLEAQAAPPADPGGPGGHRPGHRPGAPGHLHRGPAGGTDHLRHPCPLPGKGHRHGLSVPRGRRPRHGGGGGRAGPAASPARWWSCPFTSGEPGTFVENKRNGQRWKLASNSPCPFVNRPPYAQRGRHAVQRPGGRNADIAEQKHIYYF